MQTLRAKSKNTLPDEGPAAITPASAQPEAEQPAGSDLPPTGLRGGAPRATLTSRAFGAEEIKNALGIDLPGIEHRIFEDEQEWRSEGATNDDWQPREIWDEGVGPESTLNADAIFAHMKQQATLEQDAQRQLILGAGYTIRQTETGGWFALLPGEQTFRHDGDDMNYLGFFSSEKDLLDEVSETIQNAANANIEGIHLPYQVQYRGNVYLLQEDVQRVTLKITRGGEPDSTNPRWSGRAEVLAKAIVDDAWGDFCDELEDKFGHSDHEFQYEQAFERGKAIRNAMLERAAQNGDFADLMKQLEKVL